jgi:peptidoglycan/xylan/chitin deacetylase (PgdA/CDA1 family)
MSRTLVKNAMFRCANFLGVNASLRSLRADRPLIVCYHSVLPAEEACGMCSATVSVAQFRSQLQRLRKLFVPVYPEDVLAWTRGRCVLPKRAVLVTIDDGFRNNLEFAIPALRDLEIPALISVMTGFVGTDQFLWTLRLRQAILHWPHDRMPLPEAWGHVPLPSSHQERCLLARSVVNAAKLLPEEQLNDYVDLMTRKVGDAALTHLETSHRFLTWEDLRGLRGEGFTIGSHGVRHVSLSHLPADRLAAELTESKRAIEEKLDSTCDWITYPFGGSEHVSESVVEAARRAGYICGLTLFETGRADPDRPLQLDRVFIDGLDTEAVFQGRISGLNSLVSRSLARTGGDRHGHRDNSRGVH